MSPNAWDAVLTVVLVSLIFRQVLVLATIEDRVEKLERELAAEREAAEALASIRNAAAGLRKANAPHGRKGGP